VNDTRHWLLLRTFVGSSSLVVGLYGTPLHRRVETSTAPLREVAEPPERRIDDPTMYVGQTVVVDDGEPARATSVTRRVLSPSGKLLYENTWSSSYRSEPKIVRYGTKPVPKPKPAPKPNPVATTPTATTPAQTTTERTPETTTPATTTPAATTPATTVATTTSPDPHPPR
jgi:hypothetical protein